MPEDITTRMHKRDINTALTAFFTSHKKELIALLEKTLKSGAFGNRYILHPRRLKEMGKEEYVHLINYLNNHDVQKVEKIGQLRASEGLGEQTILSIGTLFRRYIGINGGFDIPSFESGITVIDMYINAYCKGYMKARESQILKDQEQLRVALSKALEQQRRELHIKNHALHTYMNGIMITDMKGRITYVNPAFLKLWKFEKPYDVMNTEGAHFLGIENFDELKKALEEDVGWQNEYTALSTDSAVFNVEVSASLIHDERFQPVGIMAAFIDVSGRNRLEGQFRQAQKMEALGQLAGGIVHDFNNLLQVISGFTELELRKMPKDSDGYKNFMQIKIASDRGKDLTGQLRFFTRQASGKHRPVDLNSILDETVSLIKRTFPPEITIRVVPDSGLKLISADPSQMSQMLLNLCVNARDAIVSLKGEDNREGGEAAGTITLFTKNTILDRRQAARFLNAKPGQYVCIIVRDTGAGISKDVQDRLFDPFFTTKGERTGTGLGLAVVYGVVQKHNGFIEVKSELGRGSSFEMYFPALESELKEESAHNLPKPAFSNGKGTVLIVEDQDQVRNLAVHTLQNCGYTVFAAEDGSSGLALYRENAEKINLVVLDVIMPKMGGRECFENMRMVNPNVKVLIITGYTVDGSAQDFLKEGAVGLIEKPFDLNTFTNTVCKFIEL